MAGRAVVVPREVHEPVEPDIAGALDLRQAVVDVGEGERGERAEAGRVAGDELRQVVVAAPREIPARRPVAVVDPGAENDRTAAAMPSLSISASEISGDQSGNGR